VSETEKVRMSEPVGTEPLEQNLSVRQRDALDYAFGYQDLEQERDNLLAEVERLSALLDQRDKKITEALEIARDALVSDWTPWEPLRKVVRVLGAGDD
jgi:hypothetical protein